MAACTEENCVGLRDLTLMRPVGYPDVFDRVGTPLLCKQGACDLLLMDELGTMERGAAHFCDAALRALDGNVPVLGVVKPRASELPDAVRAHSGVKTVTVTRENRDALFDSLDALLCEVIASKRRR